MVEALLRRGGDEPRIRAIHRTTGVLLFARNDTVFEEKITSGAEKQVEKTYRGIRYNPGLGSATTAAERDRVAGGPAASGGQTPCSPNPADTVFEITTRTGNKGQGARVLSGLHHPVVGDKVYARN